MLLTPRRHLLQPQDVHAVHGHMQISLQNVSDGASHSFPSLQEETDRQEVKPSLFRPGEEFKKLVKGFVKSMLFAGGYTLVVRRTICFLTQHYKFSSFNGCVGAFLGGATLAFEPSGRQS